MLCSVLGLIGKSIRKGVWVATASWISFFPLMLASCGGGNGSSTFGAPILTAVSPPSSIAPTAPPSLGPSPTTSAASLVITSSPPPNGLVRAPYVGSHRGPSCLRGYQGCILGYVMWSGFALSATRGTPPYFWSWSPQAGSSLPPGLSVRNPYSIYYWTNCGLRNCQQKYLVPATISGAPTAAAHYQVTVTVTDSGNPQQQASSDYTIAISAP